MMFDSQCGQDSSLGVYPPPTRMGMNFPVSDDSNNTTSGSIAPGGKAYAVLDWAFLATDENCTSVLRNVDELQMVLRKNGPTRHTCQMLWFYMETEYERVRLRKGGTPKEALKMVSTMATERLADFTEHDHEYHADLCQTWTSVHSSIKANPNVHSSFATAQVTLALLLFLYVLGPMRRDVLRLTPKDDGKLLWDLFRGMPAGTFMCSYCWADDCSLRFPNPTHFPRRMAKWLPGCWLDVKEMRPGCNTEHMTVEAATRAKFRVVFVSAKYFASPNCMLEWNVINREPEKAMVFAYPDVDPDTLRTLRQNRHRVYELSGKDHVIASDGRVEEITPLWLVRQLLANRLATALFAEHTPPINQRWWPTLRFFHAKPDTQYIWLALPVFFLAFCMALVSLITLLVGFGLPPSSFEQPTALSAYAFGTFIVPLLAFPFGFGTIFFLRGTGFDHRAEDKYKKLLPDSALLLYFLYRLGAIERMKFFCKNGEDSIHNGYKTLKRLGAIEEVRGRRCARVCDMLVCLGGRR